MAWRDKAGELDVPPRLTLGALFGDGDVGEDGVASVLRSLQADGKGVEIKARSPGEVEDGGRAVDNGPGGGVVNDGLASVGKEHSKVLFRRRERKLGNAGAWQSSERDQVRCSGGRGIGAGAKHVLREGKRGKTRVYKHVGRAGSGGEGAEGGDAGNGCRRRVV